MAVYNAAILIFLGILYSLSVESASGLEASCSPADLKSLCPSYCASTHSTHEQSINALAQAASAMSQAASALAEAARILTNASMVPTTTLQAETQVSSDTSDNSPIRDFPLLELVSPPKESLYWNYKFNSSAFQNRVNQLTSAFEPYYKENKDNQQDCDKDHPPSTGHVCKVHMEKWTTCNLASSFHYGSHQIPCVFLQLNVKKDWMPEFYTHPTDVPNVAPQELKDYISETRETIAKNIWVTCEGKSPVDNENIGELLYLPPHIFTHFSPLGTFAGHYFSNTNVDNYLPPLVAVIFRGHFATNLIISVVCKAWAKNINHQLGQGIVEFEVLIED